MSMGIVALLITPGRHKGHQPPISAAKSPRIVSLLPQATDILEGIGCGDHLVGVTGVDADPRTASLPRVGDYETTDWETIAALHPAWIITHYGHDRTPAGFVQHADAIGARQLNLLTETLSGPDETLTIYYAIGELGRACNEPDKAAAGAARLRAQLAAVHARVAGETIVPALIVIGQEGTMAAGRDSYLSELLDIAGGVNVAGGVDARYPRLDREQIVALHPEVIVQLLPKASPQVASQARAFWASLPDVPAVKNGRIVQLTQWYAMLPGYHVGDVAEEFAAALHPHAVVKDK
jgi:ABC-type Fe3+-hydroxamate transport system substrate-binding protein